MRALLLIALLGGGACAGQFDDLRLRWREVLTGGDADISLPQVRSRLASIESTARSNWSKLDQTANRRALWSDLASPTSSSQITSSWRRLRDMALAWATPGQALYGDGELLEAVRSGMRWMEANRYNARVTNKYDNWWDWEIGSPIEAGNLLVLLYERLSPEELAAQTAAIDHLVGDPRYMIRTTVSTGANRVWKCKAAILRAIVAGDEARMQLASEALSPVFAYVTSRDGFYEDGSFIQHTRHPYTGGYGLSLLGEVSDLLYLLYGSPWEVTDPARDNLYRWVFESFDPVIYRGAVMDMVRGREVSRSGSPDHGAGQSACAGILRASMFAYPEMAWYMRSMLKEIYLSDTSRDWASGRSLGQIVSIRRLLDDDTPRRGELLGSWVFAGMDRVVHRRPGWALGIAMHSSRVYNYESINNENLRAWHSSDGMTYLYNSDLTQFSDNFWPTVDPQRLPGTTVIAGSTARQSQVGGSNAVGGATMYGYTAAMMQLRPDGRLLSARKSWFLFDNEAVALGAGISSTAEGANVETVVENRLIHGEPGFTRASNGSWAHLDAGNIGYIFPTGQPWLEQREDRTGSWHDINRGGSSTPVTRRYQTIWFDHGVMPSGATYAYALLPETAAEEVAAYAAAPDFRILENSGEAQAVAEDTLGLRAVNFWTNGGKQAGGITCDRIASVLVLDGDGMLHLGVADPTQANSGSIRVEVDRAVSAVEEKDDAVTIEQMAPSLVVSVDVRNARGHTLRARFAR